MKPIGATRTSFEPGAPAPRGVVPLCAPEIGGSEWTYVKECLDTAWVSSVGSFVDRFEREVASRVSCTHAVATASGTAALHVALQVAGVRAGDEVVIPALTFIAPANAVRYLGAWPVFVDVDPDYWQMDPSQVASFLEGDCASRGGSLYNRATGRRVGALLPVDILGHPCDMDALCALAHKHGLVVIEDATESLGATYRGRPVGSLGDVGCLSFNGNKIITAGSGGMIVTNRADWAARAKYLTTQAKDDPIEFVHGSVGYNYRLSNVHAAIGCAQLKALDRHVAAKRRIAARYAEAFADAEGIVTMAEAPWASSVFWLTTILIDPVRRGLDSRAVLAKLVGRGIQARPLWQPLHLSPAHAEPIHRQCEVAERLYRTGISLPSSVGLSPDEQERVIESILS